MCNYFLEEKQFPLVTQIGDFQNERELEEWIEQANPSEVARDYCFLIKHSPPIFSRRIVDIIERYMSHTTLNISSYDSKYEKMPSYLLEGFFIIHQQMNLINKKQVKEWQSEQLSK